MEKSKQKIEKIYKAGNTLGAVLIDEHGKKQSKLINKSRLLKIFIDQHFAKYHKYEKVGHLYLYDKRGLYQGYYTVGYIDFKTSVFHMWKAHQAAQEMVEIFGLGQTAGY